MTSHSLAVRSKPRIKQVEILPLLLELVHVCEYTRIYVRASKTRLKTSRAVDTGADARGGAILFRIVPGNLHIGPLNGYVPRSIRT